MKEIEKGFELENEEDIEKYAEMLYYHAFSITSKFSGKEEDFSDDIVFTIKDSNPYTGDIELYGIEELKNELANRMEDGCVKAKSLSFYGEDAKIDTIWEIKVNGRKTLANLLRHIGVPFPLAEQVAETI